ncbi:MAG: sugar ABC transporter substrate-binding protein [Bifidobacterium tibiigranuli]|jgi:ABC-type sugar transport system substrate-binding protein|nr:sugar ABC transporter substrate-binding protein [Bifidobacterium tibiigranuli]
MRNHGFKTIIAAATAVVAALSLAACSGSGSGSASSKASKGAVAVSYPSREVTIWNDTMDVIKKNVTAQGYEFLSDNPNWDIQTQVSDWQSWISRGDVKAIFGFPAQVSSFAAVTAQAKSANIPVLGYSVPWQGTSSYLALDLKGAGEQAGKATADWVKKTYPGKKVGVGVIADTTEDLGKLQQQGIIDALNASGADVTIYKLEAQSRQNAYNVAQSALIAHPDIKAWASISGDMALGSRQATIDAKLNEQDFSDIATDATQEGYQLIKKGNTMIREAYCFTPDTLGNAMTTMLLQAAEGKKVDKKQVTVTKIDKTNVDKYLK